MFLQSKQYIDKKIKTIPTPFTYNVMHIMQEKSLTGSPSPQQPTYSMEPSYTGVPGSKPRNHESVPIYKQEEYIQVF